MADGADRRANNNPRLLSDELFLFLHLLDIPVVVSSTADEHISESTGVSWS
jgi:hypothetical protein